MASAEGWWGGIWGGTPWGAHDAPQTPSPQPTRGLGSVVSSPWGPGQSPERKRIFAYFEGRKTLIFVPI